jgi:hypothetical protein
MSLSGQEAEDEGESLASDRASHRQGDIRQVSRRRWTCQIDRVAGTRAPAYALARAR